jgi:hypothetical protein
MAEKDLEKELGLDTNEETEPKIAKGEPMMKFKDLDAVLSWFTENDYLDQEFEFDNETGTLKMNGKVVAIKGKDGSYSVQVPFLDKEGKQ